jgi:hypothetical protein
MEILSSCEANYDATGAAITSTIFLCVFVALLVFDGVLTALALKGAILTEDSFSSCKDKKIPS